MQKIQVVIAMLLLAGAAWLTTLVDDGLGLIWPHNVVRNWDEYGFFNLHGKLVTNPGGFQAATDPEIYAGHRPLSLVPYFWTQKLFPKAFAARFYYALVAAVVFFSIWQLFGRTDRAFWLGIFTIISPGYLVWQTTVDPNLAAVMAGFPFCAAVLWMLQKEKLSPVQTGFFFGLILAYTAINWTTAFIHAMLFVTLCLMPAVSRRNLVLYTVLAALSAMVMVVFSVIDKVQDGGSGHGGHGGLGMIFQAYGWGNAGYGVDLSTQTAFLRLLVVNGVGLLPVTIFLGWEWWRGRNNNRFFVFLLPLLAALLEVMALRNYFGHHPWMSCHFILLGMILSFVVWRARGATNAAVNLRQIKSLWPWVGLPVAFAYGFTVLLFYHIHNDEQLALLKLIRGHTPRPAVILIARNTDSRLADMEKRLPELFDRRVVIVDQATNLDLGLAQSFWLTAEKNSSLQLAAGTTGRDELDWLPFMRQMLHWYSQVITHRRAGDKLEFGEQYYLYH
jgi:hypothetical protein